MLKINPNHSWLSDFPGGKVLILLYLVCAVPHLAENNEISPSAAFKPFNRSPIGAKKTPGEAGRFSFRVNAP
jgi:hypothetical protein